MHLCDEVWCVCSICVWLSSCMLLLDVTLQFRSMCVHVCIVPESVYVSAHTYVSVCACVIKLEYPPPR